MTSAAPLTMGRLFRLWVPMGATWFMMSMEGLLVAAIVARLPDATVNLAAYGVAFAFALLLEAPIIMILSASTALCRDRDAFLRMRRYVMGLNILLTAATLLWVLTPLYPLATGILMDVDPDVSHLSRIALLVLLPWPAAIGHRRFYQGIMINHGHTRRVAYGTMIRLGGMGATAAALSFTPVPGAVTGAAALSVAVVLEAIVTRIMATDCVRSLMQKPGGGEPLTLPRFLRFYIPLLVSSVIALGIHPLINLFLSHSRLALESLATYPVVAALSFVFRSMGLSFQEVAIACLDGSRERCRTLLRFAIRLGLAATALQALIAFTPLAGIWFERVASLTPELAALSIPALAIVVAMPLLSVLLAFCRALLVWSGKTDAITWAGIIETLSVSAIMYALIAEPVAMIGVLAASWATVLSRGVDLLALYFWAGPIVRGFRYDPASP